MIYILLDKKKFVKEEKILEKISPYLLLAICDDLKPKIKKIIFNSIEDIFQKFPRFKKVFKDRCPGLIEKHNLLYHNEKLPLQKALKKYLEMLFLEKTEDTRKLKMKIRKLSKSLGLENYSDKEIYDILLLNEILRKGVNHE